MLLQQCNLATFERFCEKPTQKSMDTQMEMSIFTVVREVLRNNN